MQADGEPTHGSPAPVLEQHGEATVVVRLIVEVWVIRLSATLNWCL